MLFFSLPIPESWWSPSLLRLLMTVEVVDTEEICKEVMCIF